MRSQLLREEKRFGDLGLTGLGWKGGVGSSSFRVSLLKIAGFRSLVRASRV